MRARGSNNALASVSFLGDQVGKTNQNSQTIGRVVVNTTRLQLENLQVKNQQNGVVTSRSTLIWWWWLICSLFQKSVEHTTAAQYLLKHSTVQTTKWTHTVHARPVPERLPMEVSASEALIEAR